MSDFFPQRPKYIPKIYGYIHVDRPDLFGVGFTTGDVESAVQEPYKVVCDYNCYRMDGSVFGVEEVIKEFDRKRIERTTDEHGKEWFVAKKSSFGGGFDYLPIYSACTHLEEQGYTGGNRKRNHVMPEPTRHLDFPMRPEQQAAVIKTAKLFREHPHAKPRFLWNAKMRFGKTFTTYQFAKEMGYTKVLILTFKPAVEDSWRNDLLSHIDFDGWQFVSKQSGQRQEDIDKQSPFVCFGSFQDYLGRTDSGGIKAKNEWVHETDWDLIVFDEYHYGAWREKAVALTNEELLVDSEEKHYTELEEQGNLQSDIEELETLIPISTKGYLYLSGTPFKALNSGEFGESQIFSWTYADEQKAKQSFVGGRNPYESLPRMVMMTYQLPDNITQVARHDNGEFDLNQFFKATGTGKCAKFVHEKQVQAWLDIIQGKMLETNIDNQNTGARKPPFPFSDFRLKGILNHTMWFLPNISSCDAMRNLIRQDHTPNQYFKNNFTLIYAYGKECGNGTEALDYAKAAIHGKIHNLGEHINKYKTSLETKTITITCGKLTTGVTVPEWTGILMLRNLKSPETYFQSAFRVQSPWTIKDTILKRECYIFDFAPNRALKQIADYSAKLDTNETDNEKKIKEFIHYLPVLAYDGTSMTKVDASGLLDIVLSGTTSALLVKRWESALLVNVDNMTLSKLINNHDAFQAVMRIDGFRKLGENFIETIIAKSENLKKTKREFAEKDTLTKTERTQLTDSEKEEKSKRKQVQEKLIRFATRIPIFMLLTNYRENNLRDVITKIDSQLFEDVTGLAVRDFELLMSIGLFNENLMNDAVFKFRRYEKESLEYTGTTNHQNKNIGGWVTAVGKDEFVNMD